MSQNIIPVVVVVNSVKPQPGETISITATFDDMPDNPQNVVISATPAGAFSSLPSSITVPTTANEVTFQGTLATGASGVVTVSATCNNVTESAIMRVAESP